MTVKNRKILGFGLIAIGFVFWRLNKSKGIQSAVLDKTPKVNPEAKPA